MTTLLKDFKAETFPLFEREFIRSAEGKMFATSSFVTIAFVMAGDHLCVEISDLADGHHCFYVFERRWNASRWDLRKRALSRELLVKHGKELIVQARENMKTAAPWVLPNLRAADDFLHLPPPNP